MHFAVGGLEVRDYPVLNALPQLETSVGSRAGVILRQHLLTLQCGRQHNQQAHTPQCVSWVCQDGRGVVIR